MKRFYLPIMLLLSQVMYDERIMAQHADYIDETDAYIDGLHKAINDTILNEIQPPCQSKVFCSSELLKDVHMFDFHSNKNSSYLVSKKLKYNESYILSNYDELKRNNNNNTSSEDLLKFINDHFEDVNEFEDWTPPDFTENPPIINRIKDDNYRQWAYSLNELWKTLARKIKDDVRIHPYKYTMLWLPNGFIIPGGIFKEMYYWDTYWIVKGLLHCNMYETARGIIENILSLVERYGFMPNGGRVYYLNRSQPPMLILMALSYYETTGNFTFIENNLKIFETEYQFWLKNRMVVFVKDGKKYKMARYNARSSGPRPEQYKADYTLAKIYISDDEKNEFYTHIKSATESGWDFSTRWFIAANGTNKGNLTETRTTNIIPVDLNSILHVNALTLSTWFKKIGKEKKAANYRAIADHFLKSIQEVMWDPEEGVWFDWDTSNNKSRKYFYGSNIVPLWTESYDMPKHIVGGKVVEYVKNKWLGVNNKKYHGTPASMTTSSQQWDSPNAWPPTQAFIIQGLYKTEHNESQLFAESLATNWIQSNYKGFVDNKTMHEKYDSQISGKSGSGGEYEPQAGFGWTNGVVLELLNQWTELVSTSDLNENIT